MQHFLNLEKCSCGAYRYLAVREHKKTFEIYMIHHRHLHGGQNFRRYCKLASIPKFKTNIHDKRVEMEETDQDIRMTLEQVSVLRSLLKQIESRKIPEPMLTGDSHELQDQVDEVEVMDPIAV